MIEALKEFFPYKRKQIIEGYLVKLRLLLEYFKKQSNLRFYSSSLLFLYDGIDVNDTPIVDVRMIDFAHVHKIKDGGKDDGYVFGLSNLILHLEKLKEQ